MELSVNVTSAEGSAGRKGATGLQWRARGNCTDQAEKADQNA